VLSFIREEFSEFWSRIQRQIEVTGTELPTGKVTKELVEEIRNLVRQEKFMEADQLIKRLSKPVSEELLHEARAQIPEIKVHVSPTTTVLQWQSNPSM
jgi:hypothetical protein